MKKAIYPRKCDYTSKGMNKGYVFCDDSTMINDRELLIKELRKDRKFIIELLPKNTQDIKELDNLTNDTPTEILKLINSIKKVKLNKETDEELCNIAYAVDYYYYTEWDEVEEDLHYLEDGTEVQNYSKGGKFADGGEVIEEWSIITDNEEEYFDNEEDARDFWNSLSNKEKESGQFFRKVWEDGEEADVDLLYSKGGEDK
tara:strand:- start:267 stop:869 length:603 start_codon:yes stop_codon:yes gene_type:complete